LLLLSGAMLAQRPVVSLEKTQQVLLEKLGQKKAHLHDVNLTALERGWALSREAVQSGETA